MNNTLWKIKMLCLFIMGAFEDWKSNIWVRDPDQNYCCDGRECACGGYSVREVFELK